MDDEGPVLFRPEHLFEELLAGGALVGKDEAGAAAGVDEQANDEREVALGREVADFLGFAFLVEQEIGLGQAADDLVLLVPDIGEKVDDLDVGRELGAQSRRQDRQGGEQSAT